jgi:O-antigen/teichoic acid export membrane protein
MAVFAPWISRLVLGKENGGAAGIVLPLAAGGLLWQVCLLAHKPLEILYQTKRMLLGITAGLVINVVGNWLLVPRYGYWASAYLTVASASTYLILVFVLTPGREFRGAVEGAAPGTRTEAKARSRAGILEISS